jgi:hypothetical protein
VTVSLPLPSSALLSPDSAAAAVAALAGNAQLLCALRGLLAEVAGVPRTSVVIVALSPPRNATATPSAPRPSAQDALAVNASAGASGSCPARRRVLLESPAAAEARRSLSASSAGARADISTVIDVTGSTIVSPGPGAAAVANSVSVALSTSFSNSSWLERSLGPVVLQACSSVQGGAQAPADCPAAAEGAGAVTVDQSSWQAPAGGSGAGSATSGSAGDDGSGAAGAAGGAVAGVLLLAGVGVVVFLARRGGGPASWPLLKLLSSGGSSSGARPGAVGLRQADKRGGVGPSWGADADSTTTTTVTFDTNPASRLRGPGGQAPQASMRNLVVGTATGPLPAALSSRLVFPSGGGGGVGGTAQSLSEGGPQPPVSFAYSNPQLQIAGSRRTGVLATTKSTQSSVRNIFLEPAATDRGEQAHRSPRDDQEHSEQRAQYFRRSPHLRQLNERTVGEQGLSILLIQVKISD